MKGRGKGKYRSQHTYTKRKNTKHTFILFYFCHRRNRFFSLLKLYKNFQKQILPAHQNLVEKSPKSTTQRVYLNFSTQSVKQKEFRPDNFSYFLFILNQLFQLLYQFNLYPVLYLFHIYSIWQSLEEINYSDFTLCQSEL